MATYRIEMTLNNYPAAAEHVKDVRDIRERLDRMRFHKLVMQKAIGNDDPGQAASFARVADKYGVIGADQAEKNAQAKRLYDELTGFFTALDAAGGDNIRGYLGLVG